MDRARMRIKYFNIHDMLRALLNKLQLILEHVVKNRLLRRMTSLFSDYVKGSYL